MEAVAGTLYVTTDDGSYGRKGMVTSVIEDLVKKEGKTYDICVAIGPMIMMKFVCKLTKRTGHPNHRQLKSYYGRRYRNVRRLPCNRRRYGKICLCRRTGI